MMTWGNASYERLDEISCTLKEIRDLMEKRLKWEMGDAYNDKET